MAMHTVFVQVGALSLWCIAAWQEHPLLHLEASQACFGHLDLPNCTQVESHVN